MIQFKKTISETQQQLREDFRTKRCVELSPSVVKPANKAQATGSSRRRSIDFNVAADESPTSSSHVCICLYL